VSQPLAHFLFALSSELSRVTHTQDIMSLGISAEADRFESFRAPLAARIKAEVEATYGALNPAQLGEAPVVQTLLDLMFLRLWFDGSVPPTLSTWLGGPVEALQQLVDPINYQLYEPQLEEAARVYSSGSHLLLSFLLHGPSPPGMPASANLGRAATAINSPTRRPSFDDPALLQASCARSLPLVPAVPRFTLLPVAMENTAAHAARLSPKRDPASKPTIYGAGIAGPGSATGGSAQGGSSGFTSFAFSLIGKEAKEAASSLLARAGGAAKRS
jgi:hypothetical protein